MHNSNGFEEPQEKKTFLVGKEEGLGSWIGGCPWAKTMIAFSEWLECDVIIAMRCKRWGCTFCGPIKVNHYAQRVEVAKPTKFITLTCANKRYLDPREAFEKTSPQVARLAVRLRRMVGEFEYFRVTEGTDLGWPHYHLLARCNYIKQSKLSEIWAELTGAIIVDIRKIEKRENCYWYVVKYLGKQEKIEWTKRRCSWTRKFMQKSDYVGGKSLDLRQTTWSLESPSDLIEKDFPGVELHRYSLDMVCIGKPVLDKLEFHHQCHQFSAPRNLESEQPDLENQKELSYEPHGDMTYA